MAYYRIIWENELPVIDIGDVREVGRKTKAKQIRGRRSGCVLAKKEWAVTLNSAICRAIRLVGLRMMRQVDCQPILKTWAAVDMICKLRRLAVTLARKGLIHD